MVCKVLFQFDISKIITHEGDEPSSTSMSLTAPSNEEAGRVFLRNVIRAELLFLPVVDCFRPLRFRRMILG